MSERYPPLRAGRQRGGRLVICDLNARTLHAPLLHVLVSIQSHHACHACPLRCEQAGETDGLSTLRNVRTKAR